jgi:hypothetical protein
MSTTIHSDKSVRGRPKWLALGVDADGLWHNYRTDTEEIVVTDDTGIVYRQPLGTTPVSKWVRHIDDTRGWKDHPDASPGRGIVEAVAR